MRGRIRSVAFRRVDAGVQPRATVCGGAKQWVIAAGVARQAFAAAGVDLSRILIVHARPGLWSLEQALRSSACDLAFCWLERARARDLRRLSLAAGQGMTPAIVFRPVEAQREASPACLRLLLSPRPGGVCVQLLKSRGGSRQPVELQFPAPAELP